MGGLGRLLAAGALGAGALVALAQPVHSGFTASARTTGAFRAAAVFPPRPLDPPAIAGTAAVGQTLRASTGTWARQPDGFTYAWLRCDAAGQGCRPIDGIDETAYAVGPDDAGSTLRVRVTATNAGGSTGVLSAPSEVVAPAPVNTAVPSIAGTVELGETLIADPGRWSGAPDGFAYRWLRCDRTAASCHAIPDATAATHRVSTLDSDSALEVEVTARAGAASATATSAPSERLRGLALSRYVAGSAHWLSSGAPPAGFQLESALGYLPSPSAPGTVGLYGCLTDGGGQLLSTDPDCEGGREVEQLGALYDPAAASSPATLPLYRCSAGSDHWASTSPACDGATADRLLGRLRAGASYQDEVLADGPGDFLRMNGTMGAVAGPAGDATGRFTFAAPGAVLGEPDDRAAALDCCFTWGVVDEATFRAARTLELWFSTTGSGALIVQQTGGFTGEASFHVPELYLGYDGRLYAGWIDGERRQVVSDAAVNDGRWHQAVVERDGSALTLFLDGRRAGSVATATGWSDAPPGTTIFVGNGETTGWPQARDWVMDYTGRLDELSLYPGLVPAGRIARHWDAAHLRSG